MKKTLYILSVLLLGLVSCTKTVFEEPKPQKAEETGLVAVTMKVQIPQAELFAQTKAVGDRSDTPSIKDIRVAVFGTSGYPQAYALAEPVDADGNPLADYATTNHKDGTTTDTYYFKVLLPVYDGEAHVHIIANGDESIKFVDEDEDTIMKAMKTQNNVGAYWARIIMPDGILSQLDQNGIMQTDNEGNFIPSTGTAQLFENIVLVRNFAEVRLIQNTNVTNIKDVSWTLVNVPTQGSVAPMAEGTWVDDYADYTFDTETWKMVNGGKTYDGFMFSENDVDETVPSDGDIATTLTSPGFLYERYIPDTKKATCILMKALFFNGEEWDSDFTYYRLDLTDDIQGFFPIYRNYKYQVEIKKVGNRGASSITEAMLRPSNGNISLSTEAKKLTDISDGESRLEVEYVEKNFISGGTKGLWVQYKPDFNRAVDNSSVTVTVKTKGDALDTDTPATLTPTAASSKTGYYFFEFELNEQDEEKDLVSVLQVSADNGKTGDAKSTLFRDITLRVIKKMSFSLSLAPKQVSDQGEGTVLSITLPVGLPESMFPLEFKIEDVNHSLYATGEDGNGKKITVPVKSDVSLVDGKTNSFYFIRTVNYNDYNPEKGGSNIVKTEFKTNKEASATTIYVANEYFKMQSTNLLNDGMYVNPVKTTVPFNATSVEVEVEFFAPEGKSWRVAAESGITSITNNEGTAVTGGTGNGSFVLHFPANNSTTATVTRTATVTYSGTPHTVTIIQSPMEFTITPDTQTINFNETTASVTIHAEEGVTWNASIEGPTGTTPSLSESSGTGTKTLTVTLPANTVTTNNRTFTVTATMTNPAGSATASIVQRGKPNSSASFSYNAFGITTSVHSGEASSSDGYITVSLANATRQTGGYGGSWSYVRMSDGDNYGSIKVTPNNGAKITSVLITYSGNQYIESAPTCSTGSYSLSNNIGTWTVNSSKGETITFSTNGYSGKRISNIVVNCE